MSPFETIIDDKTVWQSDYVPSPNSNVFKVGILNLSYIIPNTFLEVCVLKDGRRIITQESMENLFGGKELFESLFPLMEKESPELYHQMKNPIKIIK